MRTYLKPQSQASQVLLGSRVGRTTYAQTLHFASTISGWYPQWPNADMRRAKADVGTAECAIGLEGYCRGPVAISSGPLSERNPRREYRGGSGSTVGFSARLTLCFWRQHRGPLHVDRAPQWMLLSFDSR